MLCKKPYMSGILPCPCGQCKPCRINRRRIWTTRILLESMAHSQSCFLTLTYDDEHLPKDGSLNHDHVAGFMKRLRKGLPAGSLRNYIVGEYGDVTERPHYHLALFGINCAGRITSVETGKRCFCNVCERIRSKWSMGHILVETLNRETAQYLARYVVKKMTSANDPRLKGRKPEYQIASKQDGGLGIAAVEKMFQAMKSQQGLTWLNEKGDVPGAIRIDGKAMPIGRYLLRKLREKASISEVSKNAYIEELRTLWENALSDSETPPVSIKQVLIQQNAGRVALVEAQYDLYLQKGKI